MFFSSFFKIKFKILFFYFCRMPALISQFISFVVRGCSSQKCSSLVRGCSSLFRGCSSQKCSSLVRECSSLVRECSSLVRECSSLVRGCSSQKYPSQKYPSQIKKSYGFSVFSVVIFLFVVSCFYLPTYDDELELASTPVAREEPKRSDPVKQGECKRRGRSDCEGDEDCEEICDDIFSRRRDKQECYEYSSEMVSELKDLIEATEDGDIDEIESIGPDVLECLLDIDETGFAKAIKRMSRREAQDFVVLIAGDEDFAEVLEEEDDEFNILKQLTGRLVGGGGLKEALSEEVEDDKTILWLFSEHNEGAWEWLHNYIEEECDGRDSEDCPGGENIGAYCRALLESGFRTGDWEDFLSDTGLFADEYEDEVEDEDYEYEITDSHGRDYEGDFRDYCELKARRSGGGNPAVGGGGQDGGDPVVEAGSCPTGNPNAGQILANFQLEIRYTDHRYYRHREHRGSGSGDSPLGSIGRANPAQDIVLQITLNIRGGFDQVYDIYLNEDEISYDRSRTYYIYIDDDRYQLIRGEGYERSGIKHRRFTVRNGPNSDRLENFDLAIASELNGDQCQFYRP